MKFYNILIIIGIVFTFFSFTNIFAQLSPEDQALFDQATKNAQSSLEKQNERPTEDKNNNIRETSTQIKQNQKIQSSEQFFNSNKEIINLDAKFNNGYSFFGKNFELASQSFTMNKGNTLCPKNNCKITLIETKLSQDDDFSDYDLSGKIQVDRTVSGGVSTKFFNFFGDFEVKEKIQNGKNVIYRLGGSFQINEGDDFNLIPDYSYQLTKAQVTYENGLPVLKMEAEKKGFVESLMGD